jgi:diacylglycerol kinase (ATP)
MRFVDTDKKHPDALPKGGSGVRRILQAWRNSLEGLAAAYRHEAAFRQEVWIAAVLIPLTVVLPVGPVGRALMIGSILLVLICELINSSIEAAVDRISLERHPLAKRAKDAASAAVLVALANVCLVWGCVLWALL